jgi:hypothetical protein
MIFADYPTVSHSLERTSPKGPGMLFIGTCRLCGKTGLTFEDMKREICPNPRGVTADENLLNAVKGFGEPDVSNKRS